MKNLFWMLVGTLLAGCAGSMGKGNVRGIVTDATMNTVTVVSVDNGDTLSFSTMNADRTEAQGLRLGDTLEVSYSGKYQPGMEAMRLVVHPAALVGADRDEHGCIGSAGYTWSEVRKDCIRLFEDGLQFRLAESRTVQQRIGRQRGAGTPHIALRRTRMERGRRRHQEPALHRRRMDHQPSRKAYLQPTPSG